MASVPVPARIDGDEVRQQIQLLQREPFRNLLATLLACAPDEDSLREFARKHPDRWAQSLAIAGRLAGYGDNTRAVENNWYIQINNLSDADLMARLAELQRQLQDLPGVA